MTKAQEMAQRHRNGDGSWWLDTTKEAQAYFVFDDGSVLDAWDGEPCTFEMGNGKVHAVVFEDDASALEDISSERRRKELALARLLVIAVELIRKTGDADLDIRIENAKDMIREFKRTYPEAMEI
jgi:hypothetical protein